MAKQTKQEIKSQSAGAYFTAIVNKQKFTIKPSPEERNIVKKEILAYNTKPSDNRLKKILSLLKPKEEKKKQEILVLKKQVKREKKEQKQLLAENIEKKEAVVAVVEAVKVVAEQKEEVKPEQIAKVTELAYYQRWKGYKHPETGKVWNGERYV